MLFFAVLGVLDILGGILLIVSGFIPYGESGFIITVGGVFLAKGILLSIYGIAEKKSHHCLGGGLDIIAGILLTVLYYNIYLFIFPVVGILMIIKGAISFVKSVV